MSAMAVPDGIETRPDPRFTVAGRLKSVGHALAGIAVMLRTQHNARLHLAATVAVIAAGLALRIAAADWRWLVVAIVLVWVSEGVNTAFEHLCGLAGFPCLGEDFQGHRRRRGADHGDRRRRAGADDLPALSRPLRDRFAAGLRPGL